MALLCTNNLDIQSQASCVVLLEKSMGDLRKGKKPGLNTVGTLHRDLGRFMQVYARHHSKFTPVRRLRLRPLCLIFTLRTLSCLGMCFSAVRVESLLVEN